MIKGNGNGKGGGEMLATLKDILDTQRALADITQKQLTSLREEVGGLRGEVGGLRGEMQASNVRLDRVEKVLLETRHELRELREETHAGFGDVRDELRTVNQRLDNLRDIAADRYRALEERVARLEARSS